MAKKNSSKTATEKAISASEPRVLSFKSWQGVNFVDAPLTWNPLESGKDDYNQTDLPGNFLMVQNNLVTTETLSVETRQDSLQVGTVPDGYTFTGVGITFKHWIFIVASTLNQSDQRYEVILYRDLLDDEIGSWTTIHVYKHSTVDPIGVEIREIGFFEGNLVATAHDTTANSGMLLLAKVEVGDNDSTITITGTNWGAGSNPTNAVCDTPKISPSTDRPGVKANITRKGSMQTGDVRVEVLFCYTNRLGSTLTQNPNNQNMIGHIDVEASPALWTTQKYVRIAPNAGEGDSFECSSVTGVDLYGRDTENLDWVFIGHTSVTPPDVRNGTWYYDWYGNMTDITQWVTSQLMVPTDNTTHGPDASHFDNIDSRIYFWGTPGKPYRLWIGGNPGSEFSIARGLGGAWVDIEPGSGFDVMGVAKWKTTSGANIVTIMCGNRNTTKIKRFNLVETNLTLTNEVAYKSYMYEEVSNVVGCNSRWGFGVYTDGLYSLNRYGLMLTTMAMEYNSQMKNQSMSDVISPIFTDRIGKRLRDGRMVCINDVIYIALSEEPSEETDDPLSLDNVILCYDTKLKAWYTWTHDQNLDSDITEDPDHILHIFPIDSDEFVEGLGAITETEVRLYPVTGTQGPTVPEFQVLLETGELTPRLPRQAFWYLQQLEFRFDYFVGDPDDPAEILVEGVDYYGRRFKLTKKLNFTGRDKWQTVNEHAQEGEQRNYVEWIRIDKIVESVRVRIKGNARFRLTHINARLYQQADNIGTPYGYDARDTYMNRKNQPQEIHHYIDDYNNLRRAVVS